MLRMIVKLTSHQAILEVVFLVENMIKNLNNEINQQKQVLLTLEK